MSQTDDTSSSDPQRRLQQALTEVSDLKAALQQAERNAEWQASNARLSAEEMQHFVYAVSHDLRQPLRGILTSAQLLDRQLDLKPRIEEFTASIIQGSVEINARIERLLTYSRIASNLRRSIVPLAPVVQWALMNLGRTATDAGAVITWADLPTVDIDDSTMSVLFQELFTNSILYRSDDPPKIHVTSQEADSSYIISVQDNCCGIKPEFHEKVFVPFSRLHGHEIPGFGLGLSISRKIVRAHGGRMWVESDGERGSTFCFSIPD